MRYCIFFLFHYTLQVTDDCGEQFSFSQTVRILDLIDPDVVPVDADLAERALGIFKRFGKGQGHTAQLNFGDCFAAALAERDQLRLGYIGDDFTNAGF